jgi:hypothetical protein
MTRRLPSKVIAAIEMALDVATGLHPTHRKADPKPRRLINQAWPGLASASLKVRGDLSPEGVGPDLRRSVRLRQRLLLRLKRSS